MTAGAWPQRNLHPTAIPVGPCAWRVTLLESDPDYVHAHPSLVVAGPDDDEATLAAAAPHLGNLPVLLGVRDPHFTRELPGLIQRRMRALGRERVEIMVLWCDDPLELKAGGSLQTLFGLRDGGVIWAIGLGSRDVLHAEWLALKTATRALVLPYSLADQAARYRTLPTAHDYGFACIGADSIDPASDRRSLRFALGEAERVLPVLDGPLPKDVTPMTPEEIDACWKEYRTTHAEPVPLPRGGPPEGAA